MTKTEEDIFLNDCLREREKVFEAEFKKLELSLPDVFYLNLPKNGTTKCIRTSEIRRSKGGYQYRDLLKMVKGEYILENHLYFNFYQIVNGDPIGEYWIGYVRFKRDHFLTKEEASAAWHSMVQMGQYKE